MVIRNRSLQVSRNHLQWVDSIIFWEFLSVVNTIFTDQDSCHTSFCLHRERQWMKDNLNVGWWFFLVMKFGLTVDLKASKMWQFHLRPISSDVLACICATVYVVFSLHSHHMHHIFLCSSRPSAKDTAENLLGRIVWVGWPYTGRSTFPVWDINHFCGTFKQIWNIFWFYPPAIPILNVTQGWIIIGAHWLFFPVKTRVVEILPKKSIDLCTMFSFCNKTNFLSWSWLFWNFS